MRPTDLSLQDTADEEGRRDTDAGDSKSESSEADGSEGDGSESDAAGTLVPTPIRPSGIEATSEGGEGAGGEGEDGEAFSEERWEEMCNEMCNEGAPLFDAAPISPRYGRTAVWNFTCECVRCTVGQIDDRRKGRGRKGGKRKGDGDQDQLAAIAAFDLAHRCACGGIVPPFLRGDGRRCRCDDDEYVLGLVPQ